jgi:chemotaxis protein CheD
VHAHANLNHSRPLSKPPAGFEHIRRYQDPRGAVIAKLLPGDYYVTTEDEILDTVLGSCVSACIRSPRLNIGGMNHFMLPQPRNDGTDSWTDKAGNATRYGTASMEYLINRILKGGAQRSELEVKIFGGARVLAALTDVGENNIEFVREFLRNEGLRILAEDVGDTCPRHIQYSPMSGKVRVKQLKRSDGVASRELQYQTGLAVAPAVGSIDLF